ncbi:TPA: DUF2975 domain-containing protein [Staphylococcus delphini]|nr:DUF2975 domain-containing protein [Staphylococcus delphini]HEC2203107.1 DUF2975 domain-containing protein [Staphylococcus delphini]HEC2226544.1 DUF2975 domain-containing protein [Staphylococcus delphini]
MTIPKLTRVLQILTAMMAILYFIVGITKILQYNQLFEVSIWQAPLQYQLYAGVYIVRLLILVIVFVLTFILFNDIYKKFDFSGGPRMRILYIGLGVILFSGTKFLIAFLHVDWEYVKVLDIRELSDTLLLLLGIEAIIFGTIYDKSRKLKEENDLTI